MDFKSLAIALFATHPNATVFHFTSDGMPFQNELHAEAHARSLEDRNIVTVYRNEEEANSGGQSDEPVVTAPESIEASLTDLKAKLAENPNFLNGKNKADLTKIAADCAIDISAAKTNADIVAVLASI